jgi:hypothetical protein
MVAPSTVTFMVVVPVASRPATIVVRVMPFPLTSVALFPLSTLPVTMPVIVPVTVPARTNDDNTGRFGIRRTGDANVYSNIDVCEGDGRYAYAEAGNQCHRDPATA